MTDGNPPSYTDAQVSEKLADLIGQVFSDEHILLVEERTQRYARRVTGLYRTKEFAPGRVNLVVDDSGIITAIQFN